MNKCFLLIRDNREYVLIIYFPNSVTQTHVPQLEKVNKINICSSYRKIAAIICALTCSFVWVVTQEHKLGHFCELQKKSNKLTFLFDLLGLSSSQLSSALCYVVVFPCTIFVGEGWWRRYVLRAIQYVRWMNFSYYCWPRFLVKFQGWNSTNKNNKIFLQNFIKLTRVSGKAMLSYNTHTHIHTHWYAYDRQRLWLAYVSQSVAVVPRSPLIPPYHTVLL